MDARLRRAIGEAAAALYREETGIDALFVAPGEKRPAAEALAEEPDTASFRRVPAAIEETMERAGL